MFTRLAARQAYAGSDICAPRNGDVPDLRSRHALALAGRRCRVLPEAREVVGKREGMLPQGAVQPDGVVGASLLQFAAGVVESVQAGIPLDFRGLGLERVVRVCGAVASALRIPMMPSTHSEACRPPIPNHVVHRGGTAGTRINLGTSIGRGRAVAAAGRRRDRLFPVTPNRAKLFFRLINAWYGSIPTVLTSGEGFEHRGEILHGEVMPAAFLDRLLYRCHIVDIRRNSYRARHHSELPKAIHSTAPRTGDAEPAGRERNREERRGPAGSVHCSMATDIAHAVQSSRMSPAARPDPCARHPRAVTQQYDRNGRDPGPLRKAPRGLG